jgi:predicted acylesterase/phospholipase RssA
MRSTGRLKTALVAIVCAVLSACASGDRGPINSFVADVGPASPEYIPGSGDDGSLVVGLSFSGGGARATAFAYGILSELDSYVIDREPYERTVVDDVRIVSGTSGGAIAAAYFGYRGTDGYRDLKERFLLQNAESSMRTAVLPSTLVRALRGGANDRGNFARWLDDNLFDKATFTSFKRADAPIVWLTASDIYHGTPFLFTYDTFAALCSDLDKVKLSDAVAASAAFPVVFAPLVVSADAPDCGYERPAWLERALNDAETPLRLKAYARSLAAYREDGKLKYLRLLDGGLTDNNGVTGFALERAASPTPHGPLSPEEAVKLRRLVYIVADAGRETAPEWGASRAGLRLKQILPALSQTAITSSMRDGYDALKLAVEAWQHKIVAYRCSLSREQVMRIRGTARNWNCRDVEIIVEHLSFRDADPRTHEALNAIPTRLALKRDQVDMVIEAGRQAVRSKASIQHAVTDIRRYAGVR